MFFRVEILSTENIISATAIINSTTSVSVSHTKLVLLTEYAVNNKHAEDHRVGL